MPKRIRAAIIGLEGHYSDLIKAANIQRSLEVVAISDTRPGITFRNAKSYVDWGTLLDKEQLDLVCVCGPNDTRAKILQACAAKGIPIISEKPLALTLDELRDVKRAIEKHRVLLTMLLTMRGSPPYLAMRELVRDGEIGEVISMDAQKSYKLGDRPEWMKSRQTFGGTIPYIGVHMLDLMRWISAREFKEGAAFHGTVGDKSLGEMENTTSLALKLDNGGTASLRMDYLRPQTAPSHGDDRLRIVGSKGILEYRAGDGLTLVTNQSAPRKIENFPPAQTITGAFLESRYHNAEPLLSQDDIFRISEVVLKLRDAADHKRIVSL